ncbi:MAG TPA: sigma 54-interacting transcriptional regulator [Kofleriaceae bacterium]|nr:sigma 54-interacting transcriptional regulator [Kofleriaceae bacterium]
MSGPSDLDTTFSMRDGGEKSASAEARLVAVHPPGLDWRLALGEAPVVIGREELGHGTVSRRHVEIRWERAAGHVAVDLGSHNGSRLDGSRLGDRAAALEDGGVLQLGEVFLVYERASAGGAGEEAADAIPGRAAAVCRLRRQVVRAAPDPSPVLLLGETGTGKERIAREIHRLSARSGPLVAINCAALSPQLIESQLFGHLRGAFTGATSAAEGLFRAADRGTLFLDEIGELPADLQPKLLRALQEGEVLAVGATTGVAVDVRVVAATNRNLPDEVDAGRFRRDLYARLAMWELRVPPLRDRRVDLFDWIARLHRAWCAARPGTSAALPALLPDAVEAVLLHPWMDNLRGLDRLVHTLATMSARGPLARRDLPTWLTADAGEPPAAAPRAGGLPVPTRDEFIAAHRELDGNVRALARRFNRDRRQIYRWIEAYGLARDG